MHAGLSYLVVAGLFWANLGSAATLETLSISRSGSQVTMKWDGGGLLETADRVAGPWTRLAAATSPFQWPISVSQVYFRVWNGITLTVAKDGLGSGTVTSQPPGIECGQMCSALFARGTVVTITALPDAGSIFAGWSGDGIGTDTRQAILDSPQRVTATFRAAAATLGLVNGDFESGPGVGWEQQPYPLIRPAEELGIPVVSGRYVAWLGYASDNRHSAVLGQKVTLPRSWPVYLNFRLWLYSEEICDVGYWDTFGLYINGQAFEENARLCRSDTFEDGWHRVSFDLSPYAGETILIEFAMWTGLQDPLASIALLDDLSFSASPW
jgi:hypothetical protein